MLDILGPAVNGDTRDPEQVVDRTRRAILGSLNLERKFENKPEKVYDSYEEALDRLMQASKAGNGEIPVESAKIILKRGLRRNIQGYSFTRDSRFLLWANQSQLYGMPRSFHLELARKIKIPHLIVKVFEKLSSLSNFKILFLGIFWPSV
jgi:hypothetical protein